MANTYKNIVITPNTGSSTGDPSIVFSGANANVNTDITLRVYPTSNGTLSFEGSAGQLLTITNDLSNTIFSVNDVSGLPLIEVNVTSQQITFGQYYGNVGIGTAAANSSTYKLDVAGSVNISSPTLLVAGSNVLAAIAAGNTLAYSYANTTQGAAQSYTNTMTGVANVWANTVAGYSNTWANTVAGYANTWANTQYGNSLSYANSVGTGANNQAGLMANAANSAATTREGYSNNWANTVAGISNNWANTVAGYANTWANTKLSNSTGTFSGTLTVTGQITSNGLLTLNSVDGTNEGGQVDLKGAGSYPTWSIDSYQNQLRNFNSNVGNQIVVFFNALGGSNTVNVGVNRSTAAYALDVAGQVNASGYLVNGSPLSSGSMDYAYANAVGLGANNQAGLMANASNSAAITREGYSNNWANTVAGYANTWANTKLSNTSGVSFAGDLYFPTGNVGIGITAPTSNLHVVGSANVSTSLRVGGRVNIGSAPSAGVQVYAGAAPNTLDTYVVLTDATIGSNTTSSASAFTSNPSTVAASFTLSSLNHFLATQGTIGAGSAITNQRGFYAFNSLTGATNNYGFYSDIAFGANRWNFYASGTAYNFFQGGSGFGTGPTAYSQIRMGGTAPSSSALSYSLYADQTAPSTTTSEFASYYSTPSTAAASFTLGTMFHFIALQGTIGAGSAITNQFGFYVGNNLTGATNNYGYYSNIPVGANRWNLYMNGTANNYIAGNLGIGTTSPSFKLDVNGDMKANSVYGSSLGDGILNLYSTSSSAGPNWTDAITFNTINAGKVLEIDSWGGMWTGVIPSPKPFNYTGASTTIWSYYDFSFTYPQSAINWNTYVTTGVYRRITTGFVASISPGSDGAITFSTNNISAAANTTVTMTTRMRIEANGNVSIGRTSATTYKLDVNGSINIAAGGAIAGGFTVDSFNAGANIAAYGTWTPNPTNGNYQYVTSNGSVTIAVPTSNCAIDVLWYNGTAPGSVTFSGYQAASGGGGDSYLTTANYEYILSIRRINGVSTYVWKALQ